MPEHRHWIYGAEARAAAQMNGRSDWMEVTAWRLDLELAHDRAVKSVEAAKRALEEAEQQEMRALADLTSDAAVKKDGLTQYGIPSVGETLRQAVSQSERDKLRRISQQRAPMYGSRDEDGM